MKKFTVQHLATAAAVGAVYAVLSIFGSIFGVTFALNAASVALGELIACYGLGSLLLWRLPKIPFFKNRMK